MLESSASNYQEKKRRWQHLGKEIFKLRFYQCLYDFHSEGIHQGWREFILWVRNLLLLPFQASPTTWTAQLFYYSLQS